MGNWDDLTPARRYHERTKHSFESIRQSRHYLDWDNRPNPLKEYVGLEPVPLPADLGLDRLLRWGAGVVRTRTLPGGEVYYFRTYASAGGLYPVEVYLACGALPGLGPGLYHFHPREFGLRRLRDGDWRGSLAAAAAAPELAAAGAVLVLTGILWRTAWKYQARGYRHLYWDAGTMLANLLLLADDGGLEPRLLTAFVDRDVNALVGADGEREGALALMAIGRGEGAAEAGEPEPLDLEVAPLSRGETPYPLASALHAASSLSTEDEIGRYRSARASVQFPNDSESEPFGIGTIERTLRRRGSARNFAPDPMPSSELAAILAGALAPIPSDFPPSNELFLIANAVSGLGPGACRFEPPDRFELLRRGFFRGWAGYLALEQEHAARAAATNFLLANLEAVLAALGNRGYRAAQLEAGIRAGRIYLGAYDRGFGATGLTFYDDDVSKFFTGGTAKAPMLCVAAGPEARPPLRG